jgi:hypothetical protein
MYIGSGTLQDKNETRAKDKDHSPLARRGRSDPATWQTLTWRKVRNRYLASSRESSADARPSRGLMVLQRKRSTYVWASHGGRCALIGKGNTGVHLGIICGCLVRRGGLSERTRHAWAAKTTILPQGARRSRQQGRHSSVSHPWRATHHTVWAVELGHIIQRQQG